MRRLIAGLAVLALTSGSAPPLLSSTGHLTLTFPERSPFSAREDLLKRTGVPEKEIAETDPQGARYDLEKESFSVYVPDSYKPDERWGLFVWVSPTESGRTPGAEIEKLLAQRRLLWAAPNRAGNERKRWYRYGLALDAAHNMKKLYNLDERRIYVGGYSGGGRISSVLAVVYPEVFQGGFYLFGCDYFRPLPMRDRPGAHYVPLYPKPSRAAWKLVRERNRYVFLTGDTDINKLQTQDTAQAYRKDGFAHVTYIEVPNRGHMGPMEPSWFGEGLAKLDEGVNAANRGSGGFATPVFAAFSFLPAATYRVFAANISLGASVTQVRASATSVYAAIPTLRAPPTPRLAAFISPFAAKQSLRPCRTGFCAANSP